MPAVRLSGLGRKPTTVVKVASWARSMFSESEPMALTTLSLVIQAGQALSNPLEIPVNLRISGSVRRALGAPAPITFQGTLAGGCVTAHLERSKRRDVVDADPNSVRKIASLAISNLEATNDCSRTLIWGPVVLGTVNG
jgi:hypothetical protein